MPPTDRTRQSKADEKRFPIRIRVAVPEHGTITRGPEFETWLDGRCGGRQGWAMHSSYETTRPVESFYLFLPDLAVALEFLERFNLETVEVTNDAAFPDRETLLHHHGVTGGNRTRKVDP